jgi:Rps23 Pro-64 3,4-dihydroxylase Tpa1-like proline 4-hydroxylase
VMFENFFYPEKAETILENYPTIKDGKWDGTTYLDQKNKFQKTKFEENGTMDKVFKELNSDAFLKWLQDVTEIEDELIGDEDLFGGGLHQSINGAFLNVHVDYNIHPTTKYHRRLNVLVYMNKDWKDEYEGHLELWDLSGGEKKQLGKYAPSFNRCVIFETNEISFHGHPKELKTPGDVSRKSIATYYYTKTRPANEIADNHNTIYVNTEGAKGQMKRFNSGVKSFLERINKK